MEQTFMTIHNLTKEANILFASESIADILGYQPSEVQGKSCFDYFHPVEVPLARSIHRRGVSLDKAAVLNYARLRARDGRWIGCECVFTIVHNVLVACISIYQRGAKSERRAIEAPQIRRIFSCSPRDPRYHMLEHLSPKFKMPPTEREPRAALILNRFTRNLTIMFATTAVTSILGLTPDQIKNKSFYRCIQESSLSDAMKCLESAKANDSIAYLRFFFQDPRDDDELDDSDAMDMDSSDDVQGMDIVDDEAPARERSSRPTGKSGKALDADGVYKDPIQIKAEEDDQAISLPMIPMHIDPTPASRTAQAGQPLHGQALPARLPSVELEAVVSCTSDGLVVVLRKARPPIPPAHPPLVNFDYGNDGLFAAPWGQHPIQPQFPPESLYTFRPPLLPQYMPLRENVKEAGGPPLDALMGSIRDVAVFAWGVLGINPDMATYGRGLPSGEAHHNDGTRQQQQQLQHPLTLGEAGLGIDRSYRGSPSPVSPGSSPHWASSTMDKGKGPAVPIPTIPPFSYGTDSSSSGSSPASAKARLGSFPILSIPSTQGACHLQTAWSASTSADSPRSRSSFTQGSPDFSHSTWSGRSPLETQAFASSPFPDRLRFPAPAIGGTVVQDYAQPGRSAPTRSNSGSHPSQSDSCQSRLHGWP